MKISSLLKGVGAILVCFMFIALGTVFKLNQASDLEREAVNRQAQFKQLGIDLANASDYLTNEVRAYVQFGEKKHYDNYWHEVNDTKTRDKVVADLKRLGALDQELSLIEEAKNNSDVLIKTEEEAMKAVAQGNLEKARKLVYGDEYDRNKAIIMAPIQKFQEQLNNRAAQETSLAENTANKYLIGTNILLIIATILVTATFILLFIKISKPLTYVSNELNNSDGDLRVRLKLDSQDEIGDISRAFNEFIGRVHTLVKQINSSGEIVASSSNKLSLNAREATKATQQVATTIEQVAAGSKGQAQSVMEIVQVMDEMTQSVQQVATGAGEQSKNVLATNDMVNDMVQKIDVMVQGMEDVKQIAERNGVVAENGGQSVERTVEGMLKLKDAVFETASRIHELGNQSQKIGEITEVIGDIAEQTNLLALNAAIEAARAGEHGKGFAVVADEVRKLAERSGKATKEISQLISDIQKGTRVAVESMEVGTTEVEQGVVLAREAGKSLNEIVDGVRAAGENVGKIIGLINDILTGSQEVSKAVNNVAAITEENTAATEQMLAAAQQVNSSIQNVASVSEESAAASEEVSASTEELSASIEEVNGSSEQLSKMALELQTMVSRFKV